MNYSDTLEYLFNSLPMYQRIGGAAYKANLNNTIALMDELNHPYKNFPTVHIAGTNGKGSVSHMLASAFQEAGYKTGLYTSPHLVDFRERIKINGECVSEDFVINFVAKNRSFFQKLEPSFFEMTVAMAFSYFQQQKVDIAIVEVGMGGRLDSTNLISPILSIITNIDFDHTQFLGNTIEDIAYEKAGIIKNNTAVIIGEKNEKSLKVFKEKSKANNSDLILAEENCQIETISEDIFELNLSAKIENRTYNITSPLAAWFQKINIRTALSALDYINENSSFKLSKEAIGAGFKNVIKNTGIYGRWQKISTSPTIICDAGHNAHSLKNLKHNFEKLNYNKLHLVLGFANDKDVNNILDFFPKKATYYFCKASVQRAMSEKDLLEIGSKKGINSNAFENVPDAIKNAIEKSGNEDIIYIGGSFFVVADALEFFKNHINKLFQQFTKIRKMKKNNLFNLILLISFAYFISSCGNTNSNENDKSEQDIVGSEIELEEEIVEEIDTVDYKANVDMGTEVSNINEETVSQLRKKISITKSSSPSVLVIGDSHLMGQFGENLHKNIHSLNIFDIMSISIGGAGSATYIYPLKNSCCGYSIRESLKDEEISSSVRRIEQCNYKSDEVVGKEYDGRLSNFVKEIMPEVVVIALGNNFNNSHQKLVDIIRDEAPTSEIVWVGPMKRENLDKRIRAIDRVVKDNSLFFVRSDDVIGSDTLTTAHFFGSEAKRWADAVFERMRPVLESYENELPGSTIQF